VKEYFSILEETLIGYTIPAYTKTVKRRVIQAPKFYYFDVGIPNYLLNRTPLRPGTADYGHALEHLLVQETMAWLGYNHSDKQLSYWHTADNKEVDMVVGDAELAVEVKSTTHANASDLKGLKFFGEEHPEAHLMLVSMDPMPRMLNGIEVWPATDFLKRLWSGQIISP